MLRPGLLLYKNNNPDLLLYKNNNQKAGQAILAPSLPGTGLCRIVYFVCFYYFNFVFCRVGRHKEIPNTHVLHSTQYQSKERGQTALPGRGSPSFSHELPQ